MRYGWVAKLSPDSSASGYIRTLKEHAGRICNTIVNSAQFGSYPDRKSYRSKVIKGEFPQPNYE
jgi:hypothetical protein